MSYFPEVTAQVQYEGPESKNPLAFRWYDAKKKVGGKTMAEHLRFAMAYWHTLKGSGADPFGGPSVQRAWNEGADPVAAAENTLDAAFEFMVKCRLDRWCFHDRDLAPEGATIAETNKILDRLVKKAAKKQKETGIKLLWGTANLFSHARYCHGAATNPDPRVVAQATAQVRRAMDATVELGGTGYVFWGGREGYVSLLNTDMKQEREQMAAFLHMAVDYAKTAGFKGMFFIEPKPKEPSTHQYDFDSATTLGFLREFGLLDRFQINVEANHATLAGHTFEHELATASAAGKLGSLDVNRGDATVGWDTDQFPTDLPSAVLAMHILLLQGGLKHGGLNFDAKVRRGSFDTVDLFHAHIGGMDTWAHGLLIADKLIKDKALTGIVKQRYAGFQSGMGKKILQGKATLPELEEWAAKIGEPPRTSGRQEMIENVLNDYLWKA